MLTSAGWLCKRWFQHLASSWPRTAVTSTSWGSGGTRAGDLLSSSKSRTSSRQRRDASWQIHRAKCVSLVLRKAWLGERSYDYLGLGGGKIILLGLGGKMIIPGLGERDYFRSWRKNGYVCLGRGKLFLAVWPTFPYNLRVTIVSRRWEFGGQRMEFQCFFVCLSERGIRKTSPNWDVLACCCRRCQDRSRVCRHLLGLRPARYGGTHPNYLWSLGGLAVHARRRETPQPHLSLVCFRNSTMQ